MAEEYDGQRALLVRGFHEHITAQFPTRPARAGNAKMLGVVRAKPRFDDATQRPLLSNHYSLLRL
ncbi:hypothetical protein AWB74_07537 [Caballeronia arvi]|uniref:Uncharacterized protein n=1 Tax=Caballeronia arvi TaxID=1777135 RepID=A0A158KZL0_9BURK|nr:hypothetical protein AWB74_07537 [Caballeronia arvi]